MNISLRNLPYKEGISLLPSDLFLFDKKFATTKVRFSMSTKKESYNLFPSSRLPQAYLVKPFRFILQLIFFLNLSNLKLILDRCFLFFGSFGPRLEPWVFFRIYRHCIYMQCLQKMSLIGHLKGIPLYARS